MGAPALNLCMGSNCSQQFTSGRSKLSRFHSSLSSFWRGVPVSSRRLHTHTGFGRRLMMGGRRGGKQAEDGGKGRRQRAAVLFIWMSFQPQKTCFKSQTCPVSPTLLFITAFLPHKKRQRAVLHRVYGCDKPGKVYVVSNPACIPCAPCSPAPHAVHAPHAAHAPTCQQGTCPGPCSACSASP